LKDSFEEAGKGFGETYKFRYYPARIDYIFADEKMKVKNLKTSQFINSDHFPIMARLSLSDHKSVFYLIRRWFFK
jgi:endonuclease/exonuclease/phosphatase family metal-dependent hydrolase